VQFESDDLHRETVRLLSSTARPVHDGMEDHLLLQLSKQEMNTTTKVMNPQAITSIYGEFPSLVGTELTEVRVARDEPRISIRLATGKKPTKHPTRWPQNYDEVYIGISFIGVSDLSFCQWGCKNIVDEVDLKDIDDRVFVRFSCKNNVALKFSCDWIRIESVACGFVGSP